jgi:ergothioneine biosynthesis protein EgtB
MTQTLGQVAGRPGGAALPGGGGDGAGLVGAYDAVRGLTEKLCEPLVPEDYVIQPMADASPTKWHLAHTTWFFEQFLLVPHAAGYRVFHPRFAYLFNSYYVTVGERHCRPRRGLLSRPTVAEVYDYRRHVDRHMREWLGNLDGRTLNELRPVVDIGLNHEQQHQELMLTDIKYTFAVNPLYPVYRERADGATGAGGSGAGESSASPGRVAEHRWVRVGEGLYWVGHEGEGFAYDNEQPRHRVWVDGFEIGSRLVTNGEYKAFIEDGGYRRAELWLSEGWNAVQQNRWDCPLYWEPVEGSGEAARGEAGRAADGSSGGAGANRAAAGGWRNFTLSGMRPVDDAEPVCHVSYFEADAFARWAGARLATEAEWEVAAGDVPADGNFIDDGAAHPTASPNLTADDRTSPNSFGGCWQWTRSQYLPYPGYSPPPGALGEYNGKFMCNQFVLRGGSCATSRSHVRRTYRNFFPPEARWQFSGIRLARDAR